MTFKKVAQAALALVLMVCGVPKAGARTPPAASQDDGRQKVAADTRPEFVLGPGDVVEIKFFYNAEMNDSIQVRPDGRIAMPLIGEVDVTGETVARLKSKLEALYAPHLRSPSITVQVRGYGSQKVYLGGEVPKPGTVQLVGNLTLMDAVMEAGGVKVTGNASRVVLIRKQGDGTALAKEIRLLDANKKPTADAMTALQPYDVVLVPETRIARLDRWVNQYVRQVLPLDMTLGFSYLLNSTAVIATK